MAKPKLRESIAAEAARLMLRGKESQYAAARKRATRWLSRRKVLPEDLPSNSEIESQLYALAGLFTDEQQRSGLAAMRLAAVELMKILEPFGPRASGPAVSGPVVNGAEIVLRTTRGTLEEIAEALDAVGHRVRFTADESEPQAIRLTHRYPCVILPPQASISEEMELDRTALEVLRADSEQPSPSAISEVGEQTDSDDYHPDTFPLLQMLLERLRAVRLDPERHPEGDALYHSLQVYALGLQECPYDEEFLLACLLHDVGLGIDRRDPVGAALQAFEGVLTERTCWLIRHRQDARDYLRTGRVAKSLRRSEHFDDLVLLARCDLDGRVPGADVPTIEEALDYIAGLSSAWEDAE